MPAHLAAIVERGRRTRFVKGDPRINHKGRPHSFETFRKLCQKVLAERVKGDDGKAILNAEKLIRGWLDSKEPAAQRTLAEYAFGKVPDKIETSGLEGKTTLILHFAHERKSVEAETVEAERVARLALPPNETQ